MVLKSFDNYLIMFNLQFLLHNEIVVVMKQANKKHTILVKLLTDLMVLFD